MSANWLLAQSESIARIREENEAEDAAYLIFRQSEDAGDSEAIQKAFFGSKYQLLRDRYDLEHTCVDCGEWTEPDEDPLCDRCNSKRFRVDDIPDPRSGSAEYLNRRYGK